MAEYHLSFARNLANLASEVAAQGLIDPNAKRAVLYMSLLSTEISLKAMLEKAGVPVLKIRKRSHDLAGLMRDLGKCIVEVAVVPGVRVNVAATRLRARKLRAAGAETTVGKILVAESEGASSYPNKVRYGPLPRHYPPELVAQMAIEVAAFAEQHWTSLRVA